MRPMSRHPHRQQPRLAMAAASACVNVLAWPEVMCRTVVPPGPWKPRQKAAQAFIIAAADTVMNHSSAELLWSRFPDVSLMRDVSSASSFLELCRVASRS
jgi:hypothetical protein